MAEKIISLSLIIPAYNESERISKTLVHFKKYVKNHSKTELVFVCDGTDDTEDILRNKFKSLPNIKIIVFGRRLGKGGAVRAGMQEARGAVHIFVDADLSTPLTQIPKILDPINNNDYDIVIGSRGLLTSKIGQTQGQSRETAGKIFGSLSRFATGLSFKDFQCGFKGFSQKASQIVFFGQRITSPVFDVEILNIAKKKKLKIAEVGVEWKHNPDSRIRYNTKRSIAAILDLIKIKFYQY